MVKQLRCNLRDNSVDVKPEWVLIKELTKQTFDRLPMLRPVFMQNIKECGEISCYNHTWDKSTGKKPKPLKNFEGHTFEESLFDDPVMVELIEQNVADIYTTDVVAAVLMCATKSNYSWDVEIKKFDDKIFIDKRQDDPENNILNFQTQDETSLDHQPYDDQSMNGIKPLMQEAQRINNSWLNQCLSDDPTGQIQMENENPFLEDENQVATRVGYVYKIWKLQEENLAEGIKMKKICIRCSVHTNTGALKENGEKALMNVYALNEHSLERSNWRGTIDNSIVPCLNFEVTNNSYRVSRYLVQSILSDVDFIKFAFISRKEMSDPKNHVVCATHTVKTASWAKQSNMNMDKMWCIIKRIVEEVEEAKVEGQEGEDTMGEFILLKDFNKLEFRLYKKDDADEEEDEEDQEEK